MQIRDSGSSRTGSCAAAHDLLQCLRIPRTWQRRKNNTAQARARASICERDGSGTPPNSAARRGAEVTQLTDFLIDHGVPDPAAAHQQAIIALGNAVKRQALVMGFSDTFAAIGVVLVLAAVAVAFTRKVKASGAGAH
jgi:hypothetical protein